MDTKSNTAQEIEQDLTFIRDVVERRDRTSYTSIAIAVLWAAIAGIGFTLIDFYPKAIWWYSGIAPPLGFLASFWIGGRSEQRVGVVVGRNHAVHWGSMFVLAGAVLAIVYTNDLNGKVAGQLFTLISGAACFFAGLHLDRRFIWPGVVLVAGSAAVDHIGPYPWTTVGVVMAATLIASALWMKPKDVDATTIR